MKRALATGFAVTTALCTFGFAGAQSAGDKMNAMGSSMKSMMGMGHTFKLSPQNGSGESGTATLTQHGGALTVKLTLTGGSGMQPAHIHKGTCANLNPKPAYPLATVTDGTSTTTLKNVTLAQLMSGTYAINVHKSTSEIKVYVACGNISKGAM
ncbi:MAG: CHRD domain-containing protein [Candidatus Velthaea sp.]|jgi:hypothetical protein